MTPKHDRRLAHAVLASVAVLALAVAAAPASAGEGPPSPAGPPAPPPPSATPERVACPCRPAATCCYPSAFRLRVTGHASWLRDEPEGPLGAVDTGDPSQAFWDSLAYETAGGGGASFEFPAWCGWRMRIGGTYWGKWDDRAREEGTIAQPGFVPVTPFGGEASFSSEATLWDAGATLWHPWGGSPCTDWGIGVRYASFEEESKLADAEEGWVHADARATNHLLALELAARTQVSVSSCIDLCGEVAAFGGWRRTERTVHTYFSDDPEGTVGVTDRSHSTKKDDDFGFGLSLEVSARWHLGGNWSLVGGYGLLVLFDQARAWQLADFSQDFSTMTPRTSEETLAAQRLFLGVELDL